jgi:hypothetical protein
MMSGQRGKDTVMMRERQARLVAPRFPMAAATGGLVALASASTALLVLTGTSTVAPPTALGPPLPSEPPASARPGVVVVPSPQASLARRTSTAAAPSRPAGSRALRPVSLRGPQAIPATVVSPALRSTLAPTRAALGPFLDVPTPSGSPPALFPLLRRGGYWTADDQADNDGAESAGADDGDRREHGAKAANKHNLTSQEKLASPETAASKHDAAHDHKAAKAHRTASQLAGTAHARHAQRGKHGAKTARRAHH